MDKFIGKRLDARYEIREIIGVGGMAVVYKAYDCIDDRIVAIKILKEEFVRNSEFLNRFRNESKAIAVLSHPNIVKVFDVSFGDNFQYIVMEYIDGITLKEYMERHGALKWSDALYFTVQTLRALQHAHDKGIVHRDVKPQNIMLLSDGTIKVTDFGIARFARSNQQTLTDKAIGSVHYISPEQARGNAIDEKADLYSVGVMMYEMLTGQLPFDGDTAVSIALMHMQNEPVPPRKINPSIPVGMEQIVLRAMRKNPAYRYHSDAEMLHDLEQVRRDPSVTFRYDEMPVADSSTRHVDLSAAGITVSQDTGSHRHVNETAAEKIDMLYGKASKDSDGTDSDYEIINNDRDGDEDEPPRKKSSIVPALAGIACVMALVIAGLISWFVIDYFGIGQKADSSGSVRCPNLVGVDYEEACSKNKSLSIVISSYEYSEEFPAGTIISQTEEEGKFLRKDLIVHVVVSNGKKAVTLPDVYNMTEAQATATLDSYKIPYTVTYENHGTIEEGNVIRTDPKRGDSITSDDVVTIVVSEGKEKVMVKVPSLTGLPLDEAEKKLNSLGLKLGKVKEAANQMNAGYVLSQTVESGKELAVGSSVGVTVSTGSASANAFNDVTISVDRPKDYYKDVFTINATLGSATRGFTAVQEVYVFTFTTAQDEGVIKVDIDGHLYQEWSFKRGETPVMTKSYSLSEYKGD